MLKTELEERLGTTLTDKQFDQLNELYMESKDSKDLFAKIVKQSMKLGVDHFQLGKALFIGPNGVWRNHEEDTKLKKAIRVSAITDVFFTIAEMETDPVDAYEKTARKIKDLYIMHQGEEEWDRAYAYWRNIQKSPDTDGSEWNI